MKKKEFFIMNTALVLVVAFFSLLTINLSINQDVSSFVLDSLTNRQAKRDAVMAAATTKQQCSKQEPLPLSATSDPHLTKLTEYQTVCASFATNTVMFFTSFPANRKAAETQADAMAQKLHSFQRAKITPLVIVEPYAGDTLMPYKTYLQGTYDDALEAYFKRLKASGITDQMMGTWVPFPESNTPNWENKDTEPRDFALCVNKYLAKLKANFPGAKGSILLNSATFDPHDSEWENGDYLNLTPYLTDIDRSLVSSIGIQGFPWVSRATTKRREIFRASEFLQPELAISAAQELHTRDIWFNTGSFASKYTTDSKQTVHLSLNERKAILSGILEEAKKVQTYQQNQYRVSINLFSEDKSNGKEATDWSYMQSSDTKTLLVDFLHKAEEQTIPVSLFDQAK